LPERTVHKGLGLEVESNHSLFSWFEKRSPIAEWDKRVIFPREQRDKHRALLVMKIRDHMAILYRERF
jgi:hypothetical protein